MLFKSSTIFLGLFVFCGNIQASADSMCQEGKSKTSTGFLFLMSNGLVSIQASDTAVGTSTIVASPKKKQISFVVHKGSELIACQASGSAVGTSTIQELATEHCFTDSYQLHKFQYPNLYDQKKKPSAEAAQN